MRQQKIAKDHFNYRIHNLNDHSIFPDPGNVLGFPEFAYKEKRIEELNFKSRDQQFYREAAKLNGSIRLKCIDSTDEFNSNWRSYVAITSHFIDKKWGFPECEKVLRSRRKLLNIMNEEPSTNAPDHHQ